jgi:predicted DNA-binding ribbon-helix-helix protein
MMKRDGTLDRRSLPQNRDAYKTRVLDTTMGLDRSITIKLPGALWDQLDAIARADNRSKQFLLEPIITRFVRERSKAR